MFYGKLIIILLKVARTNTFEEVQDKIDENDHTAVARFSFDFKAKQ